MTSMIDLLRSYAPLKARKFWTVINALLCVWSILLLVELSSKGNPLERLETSQAFLAYNFGTTFAWVIEVFLNMCDRHWRSLRRERITNTDVRDELGSVAETALHTLVSGVDVNLVLEFVFALYFLVGSVQMFQAWQNPDQDVNVEFGTALITGVFYMYETVRLASSNADSDNYVEIV